MTNLYKLINTGIQGCYFLQDLKAEGTFNTDLRYSTKDGAIYNSATGETLCFKLHLHNSKEANGFSIARA